MLNCTTRAYVNNKKDKQGHMQIVKVGRNLDLKQAVMQELNLFYVVFDFDMQKKGTSQRRKQTPLVF